MVTTIMNCLYSFEKKEKTKSHENVYKHYDYCHMTMPEEGYNIL